MIQIDKAIGKLNSSNEILKTKKTGAHLVLQMHDELIYEIDENDVDVMYDLVKNNMENCMEFDVKMTVKIKIGKTWSALETYSK
jgi:DNA polymerase-1